MKLRPSIRILLLISLFLAMPLYAEEDKAETGWRKTAKELDDAGGDAGDAIDNAVDKATKKIIGQSAGDKVGKAKNALGIVDDLLDATDKATTVIEGIQEGDAAKVISPIVGQDTADKISAKEAKEYDKEEGKALTAKEAEVRQAIKHKLRRKGATKEETKEAMKHYDNGDKKKFRNAIKEIKAKGIEDKDKEKHGLTPDKKSDDEYNVKDQLYEGAKAAAKKADDFYGGIVQKQQASNKEFEKLKKEQEHTQQGIQDEVDNAVVKKMMRKGIPYKEARRAVDEKRKGNADKFNKIAKKIANKKDPGQKGSGLTAEGKTGTFEADDYGKDIIDKEKQAWEGRSKKMMRAPNKILDYLDKKDLAEKDEQQWENETYGKFRKAGATKEEARAAASDYVKGKPEKATKLARKLQKERKDKSVVGKNDLFTDDDQKNNATAKSDNHDKNLKDSEYDNGYVDLPDADQKDTAEMAILRKELKRQKENAFSAKVNRAKNDMANASTSGDQSIRDSQAKIDQANVEGESVKIAAADKSNADYQDNSFGEQMSTEVTEGIKQGFETAGTAVGTAIGEAMARKIIHKDRREERRGEWEEGDGDMAASDAPGGGGDAESSGNRQSSGGGGKGQRQVSGGKGTRQSSNGGIIRQTSGGKPVKSGSCPMCNVGKFGPWRTDAPTYNYRFCRLCGYKQTRNKGSSIKKPASSSTYSTCARCGLSSPTMLYEQVNGKWYCTTGCAPSGSITGPVDARKKPAPSPLFKCDKCGYSGPGTLTGYTGNMLCTKCAAQSSSNE